MPKRMQANTEQPNQNNYHAYEHEYHETCETVPRCAPITEEAE